MRVALLDMELEMLRPEALEAVLEGLLLLLLLLLLLRVMWPLTLVAVVAMRSAARSSASMSSNSSSVWAVAAATFLPLLPFWLCFGILSSEVMPLSRILKL